MSSLDLATQQRLLLELLHYIDDTCARKGLRYSLCGGTLLGAVREGGFLTWDDDADVMMPRDDYERFLQVAHDEGVFRLLDRRFQGDYYYHFAKLSHPDTVMREENVPPVDGLGVFVDIFPADRFPRTPPELRMYMKRLQNLRRKWWLSVKIIPDKKLVRRMLLIPYAAYCKARGIQHWYNLIDAMIRDPQNTSSPIMGFPVGSYKDRDIFTEEMFAHYIPLPFEGGTLQSIRDYDVYLSSLYGDYMTPPPPGKEKVHGFPAYWKGYAPWEATR